MLAGCLLLFAPASLRAQQAGNIDPSFGASLGLAGHVLGVIVQPDGKMLVNGDFRQGIVRLSPDGTLTPGFNPGISGSIYVYDSALQADGKILIAGGGFGTITYAGGAKTFGGIVRLNANGSLDITFNPGTGASSIVQTVAVQADGKIIIGGYFTSYNGTARKGIARLNANGTLDTAFNPVLATSTTVSAAAVQTDGKIVIAGTFATVNGTARKGIARLNADGTLDATFNPGAGPTNYISVLTFQPDGKILVGGNLVAYNNVPRNGIARLNADGSLDTTFNPGYGANNGVNAVTVQPDGKILVGGFFDGFNDASYSRVARLNADGSLDTGFNPGAGADTDVYAVALQADGRIIVGGSLTTFDNVSRNGVARLNADGSLEGTFLADIAPGPNLSVTAVAAQPDGKTIVGGFLTTFNGTRRGRIARLNVDGTLDTSFDPGSGADYNLWTVALQSDGKIIIGGRFVTVGGLPRASIARLNADGSVDTSFDPGDGAPGDVYASAVQTDGKILIGGTFATVNGVARQGIARLNANGSVDTTFVPTLNPSAVLAMAVQSNGKILIGGFSTTAGLIARLNTNGSTDTTFSTAKSPNSQVNAVAVQTDGKVLIGGYFSSFGTTSRNNIARLSATGVLDTAFNPGADADGGVLALSVQTDGKIIAGGQFTTMVGAARGHIVRLNVAGTADTGFVPGDGANGTVNALALRSDGKIIAGGEFNAVSGFVRNYVARFNIGGSLDAGFNPGVGTPSITALSLQPADGKVFVGGAFTAAGAKPANALARLRTDGSLDPAFTAPFNPGDAVQTLVRQPGDGSVVASALPASGVIVITHAARPHVQSKVKNPIVRCIGTNGRQDDSFFADAGTDGTAFSLGLQGDGKIVVGGLFNQLNSTAGHANLGRLNADGTLDTAFNATADATVQAVLTQPDGKIVVGGLFSQINGQARVRLARLQADGTLDASFNASAGTDKLVAALKLQSDGRLVIGGTFAVVNTVARSCVARLNTDGTLDTGFNAGTVSLSGGTALVSSVDQQPDGKLIVAGLFDHVGGAARNNVARLNPNGSVDTTFNPGAGSDAVVRAIALQPDGKTLLGGDFTTVDSTARAAAARLLGDYDLDAYPALGQWRIINFGQPDPLGNAADTAAPFNDGVPNLVKYALNLNPQAADATPMTATGTRGLPLVGRDATGAYLTLTFVRRQAATAPGVTYNVEFASGLAAPGSFAVNPAASVGSPVAIDAVWERVTVTDSVPISTPQQPARFVHLRITSP